MVLVRLLVETATEYFFGIWNVHPNRVANPVLEMHLMCKPGGDTLRQQDSVIHKCITKTNTLKNTSLLRNFYDNRIYPQCQLRVLAGSTEAKGLKH